MKTNSNTLLWIVCFCLGFAGIGLAIHAVLNFDKAAVIVEWTTASELDTVGYNLQRGETPVGPFEQVKGLRAIQATTVLGVRGLQAHD